MYFHPAAAEPPLDISAYRDPPNASEITVTWTMPTTGPTPTGYIIRYWTDNGQDDVLIESGNATMAVVPVKPTEPVYSIIMFTLSDMLLSKPSSPVLYSET